MTNWDEYKEHVRATDAVAAKIIDETEMLSPIIAEMIVRRKELGLNQRELAEKCGVPQSTIARMESGAVTPKTETLLKACRELGLRLTVERI
jgi:DNA-binding XRE family transcriptional regulator